MVMTEIKKELPQLDKEVLAHDMEIWKVAIDTQMHFNDLLIKMRTTVISIILAVFGAAAIALNEKPTWFIQCFCWKIHVSAIVLILGLIFLLVQFIIDRCYYFEMLLGAVKFARQIDERYENSNMKFGLTNKICRQISEPAAILVLWAYYGIPFVLGIISIYLIATKVPQ